MTVTDKKLGFLTIAIIILLGILLIIATGKPFVVPIGPVTPAGISARNYDNR